MSEGESTLGALLTHPLLNGAAPDRIAYTLRDAETVPASERYARGIAAIRSVPDWQRAEKLVRYLGVLRYEPAVPTLIRLWQKCPVSPVRVQAGEALCAIGSPEAREALREAIDDHDPSTAFLPVQSIVFLEPGTAFDHLRPYFTEEALTDKPRYTVAGRILFIVGCSGRKPEAGGMKPQWHHRDIPDLLRSHPEWIQLAIGLREHRHVGTSARRLLGSLTPDEIEAALKRWPDPPKPHGSAPTGRRDYLVRYESGEHETVWRELTALGPLEDAALRTEAEAVARATMARVRHNVELITQRLVAARYPFDNFRPPWTPPASDVEQRIQTIESIAGGPVPISLRAFWTVVGEVHWLFDTVHVTAASGSWGSEFPLAEADPLCVYGPSTTDWSVTEWLKSREKNHAAVAGPLFVVLAPDFYHKAKISGGLPYTMRIPDSSADGYFENEAHDLRFVEYLRLCFRWGGFSRAGDMGVSGAALDFIEGLKVGLEAF